MLRSNFLAMGGALLLVCGCAGTRTVARDAREGSDWSAQEIATRVSGAATTTSARVLTTGADIDSSAPDGLGSFDRALAVRVVGAGLERAKGCRTPDGPTGKGRATLTFENDGSVASVELDEKFRDTEVGNCIVAELGKVFVSPFAGDTISANKTFEIPPAQGE